MPHSPSANQSGKSSRKRVLVLAAGLSERPTDGGEVRLAQLVRETASIFDCDVVCFTPTAPSDRADQLMILADEYGIDSLFPVAVPGRPMWLCALLAFATSKPIGCWKYRSRAFSSLVRDRCSSTPYDACFIFSYTHMAQFAEHVVSPKMIWDMCDDDSVSFRQRAAFEPNLLKRILFGWHATIIERYMKHICQRFDSILVIADKDSNKLNGFYANPVVAVPNYVDTTHYAPEGHCHDRKSPKLLFTGAMKWWPNQDAVSFFTKDVLPLIEADTPDITFQVVGKDADALEHSDHGNISATGFVEDLSVHYRSCDVYVCPLRKGTGIKNKVLEAMACGCAVVATEVAAEGLDVRDGQELLVADTPAEIAGAVKRLIGDPDLRNQLGAAARSFVEREFSPNAMRAGLEKAMK